MKDWKFSLIQNVKISLKIVAVLLPLSLVTSGCVRKQYFIPGFDTSEYQELKAGNTFTATFDSLCVSKQYAQDIMGVDGISPSQVLKEKKDGK